MITSAQQKSASQVAAADNSPLAAPGASESTESREADLWGEVLLRAIDDFKTYMAYKKDPEKYSLSAKMLRSIVADGCDPEYWIFDDHTGFDAVCMVLDLEPDCIRRFLREWLEENLGMEPSY